MDDGGVVVAVPLQLVGQYRFINHHMAAVFGNFAPDFTVLIAAEPIAAAGD